MSIQWMLQLLQAECSKFLGRPRFDSSHGQGTFSLIVFKLILSWPYSDLNLIVSVDIAKNIWPTFEWNVTVHPAWIGLTITRFLKKKNLSCARWVQSIHPIYLRSILIIYSLPLLYHWNYVFRLHFSDTIVSFFISPTYLTFRTSRRKLKIMQVKFG
jgi:hypothetical protein